MNLIYSFFKIHPSSKSIRLQEQQKDEVQGMCKGDGRRRCSSTSVLFSEQEGTVAASSSPSQPFSMKSDPHCNLTLDRRCCNHWFLPSDFDSLCTSPASTCCTRRCFFLPVVAVFQVLRRSPAPSCCLSPVLLPAGGCCRPAGGR